MRRNKLFESATVEFTQELWTKSHVAVLVEQKVLLESGHYPKRIFLVQDIATKQTYQDCVGTRFILIRVVCQGVENIAIATTKSLLANCLLQV